MLPQWLPTIIHITASNTGGPVALTSMRPIFRVKNIEEKKPVACEHLQSLVINSLMHIHIIHNHSQKPKINEPKPSG